MDIGEKIVTEFFGYLITLSAQEKALLLETQPNIAGGIIHKTFSEAFKAGYQTANCDLNREYLHKN